MQRGFILLNTVYGSTKDPLYCSPLFLFYVVILQSLFSSGCKHVQ